MIKHETEVDHQGYKSEGCFSVVLVLLLAIKTTEIKIPLENIVVTKPLLAPLLFQEACNAGVQRTSNT